VLVEARTVKEAARTAAATGGVHLPGKEPGKFSPRVLVTGDFEAHRAGRKVGFPKFKSRHRDQPRVRSSTGAMGFGPDRRSITLPVIGTLRSKENTRRAERHLSKGNARLLSLTVSERWGRLSVSANYAVRTKVLSPSGKAPRMPEVRAGTDLGLRDLATVAGTEGNITIFPNPAPLRASLTQRRAAGRQVSRRIPGSRGHRAAKAKLARLDRRCVHLRLEPHHQLTRWLVGTYGENVVEDLDLAAMERSMGRRAFRRSVSRRCSGPGAPDGHLQGRALQVEADGRRPLVPIEPGPPRLRLQSHRRAQARQDAGVRRDRGAGGPGHQCCQEPPRLAGPCQLWLSWSHGPVRQQSRWQQRGRRLRCSDDCAPGEWT
jgi:hypothetical protein